METYRIEVGHQHGVKPANIVGAIANEAGLESRYIGRIGLFTPEREQLLVRTGTHDPAADVEHGPLRRGEQLRGGLGGGSGGRHGLGCGSWTSRSKVWRARR